MKKALFIFLGSICTILGVIGIFLPILPTTPFLLLAAWLFVRSSDKLYDWLINHRVLGIYIKSYIKYKGVDRKHKVFAISMIWITILFSITIVEPLFLKILLVVIMITFTIYISSLKTLSKEEVIALEEFERRESELSKEISSDSLIETKHNS